MSIYKDNCPVNDFFQINLDENHNNKNIEKETKEDIKNNVHINLTTGLIKYEMVATGQIKEQTIQSETFILLTGRIYYIPVKEGYNSDCFNIIKVYSDFSNKFDVRFVKDNFICIIPLQHGAMIKNNDKICSLI